MSIGKPGEGRYARWERERRYLMEFVPDGLGPGRRIEDRYLDGTRLRIRHVAGRDGTHVWKLGQKVRPDERDPSAVRHTTTYLDEAEHALLRALPGEDLVKVRRPWLVDGRAFAVDELLGRHEGIVLAETEVAQDEVVPAPPGALLEVTHDDRFSGATLARSTDDELAALRTAR